MKPKNKKIGALWMHETHAGDPYFTGTITVEVNGQSVTVDVSIFLNKFKVEANSKPDLIVYTPDYGESVRKIV